MHSKEKQSVIDAIGDLGRRVTAADVATKTGLPVLVAQQELNKVAAETSGHLQVGTTGDIVYAFAPGFSNTYITKGIAGAFLAAGKKFIDFGMYLLRISFGIALILSLIIVVVVIALIALLMLLRLFASNNDNDSPDFGGDWGGGLGGFRISFWDWMLIRDIFMWNSMRSGYAPVVYDYSAPTVRKRERSSFLLNCFSFLFGDGDPNEGLEQKQWQVIAQVIKKHNNVVTAEQLAPYTGADPTKEDGALPVLVRFNGRPEVTDSGNIVYVFESLQPTAADQTSTPMPFLREFPWKFTNVPDGELLPVYIVAGLNLAGSWWLFNFFSHAGGTGSDALQLLGGSALFGLITVLVCYAVSFLAIPLVRAGINSFRNKKIEARNKTRMMYAERLRNADEALQKKLEEASTYKMRSRRITERDIVYTTEKDSLDQDDALSDKFKDMEEAREIDAAPNNTIDIRKKNPKDKGGKINIRDLEKEFDASP